MKRLILSTLLLVLGASGLRAASASLQYIDTTVGAGDTAPSGGNKINANFSNIVTGVLPMSGAAITNLNLALATNEVTRAVNTNNVGQQKIYPLLIPTPDAYTDVTHASVIKLESPKSGYHWWMAYTPYPPASTREKPNVAASRDGIQWEVPAGVTNPLVNTNHLTPLSGWTADTEITEMTNGDLVIWYMEYLNLGGGFTNNFMQIRSSDGITWSAPEFCLSVFDAGQSASSLTCPSVVVETNGVLNCWFWNDNDSFLQLWRDTNGWGTNWYKIANACTNKVTHSHVGNLWHGDVTKVFDTYYMMYTSDHSGTDRGYTDYGFSKDGTNWYIRERVLSQETNAWAESWYKHALVPHNKSPLTWDIYSSSRWPGLTPLGTRRIALQENVSHDDLVGDSEFVNRKLTIWDSVNNAQGGMIVAAGQGTTSPYIGIFGGTQTNESFGFSSFWGGTNRSVFNIPCVSGGFIDFRSYNANPIATMSNQALVFWDKFGNTLGNSPALHPTTNSVYVKNRVVVGNAVEAANLYFTNNLVGAHGNKIYADGSEITNIALGSLPWGHDSFTNDAPARTNMTFTETVLNWPANSMFLSNDVVGLSLRDIDANTNYVWQAKAGGNGWFYLGTGLRSPTNEVGGLYATNDIEAGWSGQFYGNGAGLSNVTATATTSYYPTNALVLQFGETNAGFPYGLQLSNGANITLETNANVLLISSTGGGSGTGIATNSGSGTNNVFITPILSEPTSTNAAFYPAAGGTVAATVNGNLVTTNVLITSNRLAGRHIGAAPMLPAWSARVGEILDGQSTSVVVAVIGDSYVAGSTITIPLRDYLQASFGNGGNGWTPAGNLDGSGVNLTTLGTWTTTDGTNAFGADGFHLTSTDTATPASLSYSTRFRKATLYYAIQPGGGTFRWRADSGTWITNDTDGVLALGTSVTNGLSVANHTFTIEVLTAGSAGVSIIGVDFRWLEPSAIVHRLGNSGWRSEFYRHLYDNSPVAAAHLNALAPDLILFHMGVNDMANAIAINTFRDHISNLVYKVVNTATNCDIAFLSQCESGDVEPIELGLYFDAISDFCVRSNFLHIDAYSIFGPNNDYVDLIKANHHPSDAGGQAWAKLVYDALCGALNCHIGNTIFGGAPSAIDDEGWMVDIVGSSASGTLRVFNTDTNFTGTVVKVQEATNQGNSEVFAVYQSDGATKNLWLQNSNLYCLGTASIGTNIISSAMLSVGGLIETLGPGVTGLRIRRSSTSVGQICSSSTRMTYQDICGAGHNFLGSNSLSMMFIDPVAGGLGNLGIAESSPKARLHVNGTAIVTNTLWAENLVSSNDISAGWYGELNGSGAGVTNLPVAGIAATGIAADKYLKGDGTWAAPAGSGDAVLAANQTWTGTNTWLVGFALSNNTDGVTFGTAGQVLTSGGYNTNTYWSSAGSGDVTTAQLNSASNSLALDMTNHVALVAGQTTNEVARVAAETTNHVALVAGEVTNEVARVAAETTNHVALVAGETTNEVARVAAETTNHVTLATNQLSISDSNLYITKIDATNLVSEHTYGQVWYVWGSSNALATNAAGTAYKAMWKSDTTLPATANTNTYSAPSVGTYIAEVITAIPAGVSAITPGDIQTVSFLALNGANSVTLLAEIYIRTNNTSPDWTLSEREIGVGPQFVVTGLAPTAYTTAVPITTNVVLETGHYLVRKLKVVANANSRDVLAVSQGAYPSRVTFPIGTASFVLKSGDTMSGSLSLGFGAQYNGLQTGLTNAAGVALADQIANVTNNTKIARTDFANTFTASNGFSGLLVLTGQGATTNALADTNVVDMAIDTRIIVATGTISISNCANTVVGQVRKAALLIDANGANRTIRVPDWVMTTDGLRTWTCTNAQRGMLYIETYGQLYTNASYTPLF